MDLKKLEFETDSYSDELELLSQSNTDGLSRSFARLLSKAKTSSVLWSWIGSFLGISILANMHSLVGQLSGGALTLMIGSFGASAVLAYCAIESPLAKPKNIIGGHVLSALVGVTIHKLFGGDYWLASALAVSIAIVVMQLTDTVHPPGGATALIAVTGGPGIYKLGYLYPLIPVALGAIVIVIIAIAVNNIPTERNYPLK